MDHNKSNINDNIDFYNIFRLNKISYILCMIIALIYATVIPFNNIS